MLNYPDLASMNSSEDIMTMSFTGPSEFFGGSIKSALEELQEEEGTPNAYIVKREVRIGKPTNP